MRQHAARDMQHATTCGNMRQHATTCMHTVQGDMRHNMQGNHAFQQKNNQTIEIPIKTLIFQQ
jgi:hypothetical protein